MQIITVQEFNHQARGKYNKAVSEFEFGEGGFPYLPMYTFNLQNGEEMTNGFVATDGRKHCYGTNKKQATSSFNS